MAMVHEMYAYIALYGMFYTYVSRLFALDNFVACKS